METNLRRTTVIAFFSALTCVGAFIVIPVGPVPIVLQNMIVILAGLLLGPAKGTASVALFLFVGAIGFPVFSGGRGGLAHFAGPTGGYLAGYLLAAFVAGLVNRKRSQGAFLPVAASILAAIVVYLPGVTWLKLSLHADWTKALAVGLLPFLIPDLCKAVVAGLLAKALRPAVDEALGR
jgi:biotin transport system substrate-specific component